MSLAIKMTFKTDKTIKSYRKKRNKIQPGFRKALNEIGAQTIKIAQGKVPVSTGRLRAGLDFIVVKVRKGYELVLGTGLAGGDRVPYALVQEEGGPGIRPHWYMRRSIQQMKSARERIFKKRLRKSIK